MTAYQQTNETVTVDEETSEQLVYEPKYRCFCIPQRGFIIILALIKVMLNWWLVVILLIILLALHIFGFPTLFEYILTWLAVFINVVDIVFGLVIILGVSEKNPKKMKIYYTYSTFIFASVTFLSVFIFLKSQSLKLLKVIFIFSMFLMIQEYLNYLVRSEVRKLERSQQFQL